MDYSPTNYRTLSDAALVEQLRDLARHERRASSEFLACLAEADRRPNAVIGQGYPSLFDFCVRDLRLAESTAYQRVKAARLVNARPEILSLLANGSINLSNLCLIAPYVKEHPDWLDRIKGQSKRAVERLVASLGDTRQIPDRIRVLPPMRPDETTTPQELPLTTQRPGIESPISEPVTEFRFAAGSRFVDMLERLRSLLWHKFPQGRLEDILLEAISTWVDRHDPSREPTRHADRSDTASPASSRSRHIPADVKRAVWKRDGGRCSYVGPMGCCSESRGLEIDHIRPWALGGRSDDPSNLRLLCRAHNQHEAMVVFGDRLPLKPPNDGRVVPG